MRDGGDVAVCVGELRWGAGASGGGGPAEEAVGAQDEPDGGVGDGFRARGCGIAVDDAAGGEEGGVDPVEARAGGGEDLTGWGEEGDELGVPVAHFAARVPEGPVHGGEGAEFVGLEGGFELVARHGVAADDGEFGGKGSVEVVVPFYVVA